jgi:hypothetical protein
MGNFGRLFVMPVVRGERIGEAKIGRPLFVWKCDWQEEMTRGSGEERRKVRCPENVEVGK